jgi:cephalosporin hydroxylase
MIPYKLDVRFTAPAGRYYRHALFETLKKLGPRYCLEIGTNHGATARVFQTYFDECMPEGRLITCDIKEYNQLNLPNVIQLQVHSWISNPWDWHVGNDGELIIDDERNNLQIIMDEMKKLEIKELHFIFVDGDHTEKSVKADLQMCASLPHAWPRYTLIDDTDNKDHDVSRIYNDIIKKNSNFKTYDYHDWKERVGASLIWQNDMSETTT